jgi:glycosyltransferase involved in cell wall biosynthesis
VASSGRPVTVVTITRNNLAGLHRTFGSLAIQDFRDVQHVIIDGASTDGSVAWLQANRIFDDTVVVSEPDNGIYDAMNKGVRIASGTLVNFLNAGDAYARPGVLSDAVTSHLAHGWAWAFGLARVVNEAGEPIRPVRPIRYSFRRHALGLILVPHQAVFMQRSLIRELGGFDERFGLQADVHLLLRAAERARPAVWNRVDVAYLAGGATDRQVYPSIYRKHLIRRSLTSDLLPPGPVDLVWTVSQMVLVAIRKTGKRVLNTITAGQFTRWWAARGL